MAKFFKGVRDWIRSKLDDDGHEKLSDVPKEIPLGFQRPETMEDIVKRLMRADYARMQYQKDMSGYETPEEADDFDVDDDYDSSLYSDLDPTPEGFQEMKQAATDSEESAAEPPTEPSANQPSQKVDAVST